MVKQSSEGDVIRYAGAAVGAIPAVGSLAQEFTTDALTTVFAEHARLRSVALRAAERSSGMSREDISEAIVRSPHLVPLVTRVLWVAGMNGHDEMLEILGGILGSIMLTPDDTEEAELILAGVTDLRRVHLQVLQRLGDRPQVLVETGSTTGSDANEDVGQTDVDERGLLDGRLVLHVSETWNAEALAHKSGLTRTRTQLALAGLMSAGFAISPPVIGGPGYLVSPAGTVLWEAIQRRKSES